MSAYKNISPRLRFVVKLYLFIALPFMMAALIGSAVAYATIFSLKSDTPLSFLHLLGILSVMLVAIVVGLAIGGWTWALLGKLFFGLGRSDVEDLFATGPQIGIVSKYNEWCLNLVFGRRQKQEQDNIQSPDYR
jgi:hypothetical protein